MSMFYAGRHRASIRTTSTRRAGAGVVAVAALSLGVSTIGAQSASAAPSTQSVSAKATFSGLVKQGSRGSLVKQVQRKVGVSADGVFGPRTKSAVKHWQKRHGLVADGVVGSRTGTKMGLRSSTRSTRTSAPKRSSRTSTRSVTNGSVLSTASRYVGSSYRSGGTSPSGWDCSGFTKYVFARHGKNLPRTAEQQRRSTTRVSSPRPGDLVFFGAPAWHVGIYAGNGKMFDAGNSRVDTTKRAIWTNAVTYGRV